MPNVGFCFRWEARPFASGQAAAGQSGFNSEPPRTKSISFRTCPRTCEGGAQGPDAEPKTHFAGDLVQLSCAEDHLGQLQESIVSELFQGKVVSCVPDRASTCLIDWRVGGAVALLLLLLLVLLLLGLCCFVRFFVPLAFLGAR